MTIKDSKYVKVNSPLYLIFEKVNGYFEENNGNKYLTLVPSNKRKEIKKKKKKEKLWCQIRYLIRSITKISDDYGKIYMK